MAQWLLTEEKKDAIQLSGNPDQPNEGTTSAKGS